MKARLIGLTATTLSVAHARAFLVQQSSSIRTAMSLRANKMIRPYHIKTTTTTTSLRGGSSTALNVFDNTPLWRGSGMFVAANTLGYVVNVIFPSAHYHVDLLGTGAFAAAALPTFLRSNNKRIVTSSAAVLAWSVKLASFLLYRVIQTGHDSRLDDILSDPTKAAGFWIISAAWGLICSLPHALGTTSNLAGNPLALRAGTVLFGAGWIIETLADYQKWMFKQSHPGQFCDVGLWSLSQHPNWFGNILLWSGIFVMNAPALIEQLPSSAKEAGLWKKLWSYRRVALAFVGPAFMWSFFNAQANGKILEESFTATQEKYGYGKDTTYTNYVDNTPLLIPNPLNWFL